MERPRSIQDPARPRSIQDPARPEWSDLAPCKIFRALKSELAIRPIFHQKEHRVKAHILIAFLGYALWVTFKRLLKSNCTDVSPGRALALLSTLQSADIILPTTDGHEIRLRRITQPNAEQKLL